MTTPIEIPLSKLVPFPGNVRKTYNKDFIAELAASIRAHGLQQNLVVRKVGKQYEVVSGGQRLKALMLLAKEGHIKPGHLVLCKVANDNFDAAELSLVENVMRDDMHPADKFEAFRDLVDKGHSIAEIAARFGATERTVRELLKLASVSQVLLKAYRDDKLKFDQVMAFAVSDDHAAQERLFQTFGPHGRDPRAIRAALTQGKITTDDKRVKFVTRKAYEAAGGAVRPDWFGKSDDSGFILDPALLDRLMTEKLDGIVKELAKEGWKWTEARPNFGYQEQGQFRRIHADVRLPSKLAKEAEKLDAVYEKLAEQWEQTHEDAEFPERLNEIPKRLREIKESGKADWKPEQLAMAGAVVTIGDDGKSEIMRGLVRPEDMPKEGKKGKAKGAQASDGADGVKSPALSAALVESLSAHKSAALAAELAERPDVSLAAVVHALASRVLLNGSTERRSLQVSASPQSLHRVEGSKAFERLEAARKKWSEVIPTSDNALWTWCLEQKQETLLQLLAFCSAVSVNAVQGKGDRPGAERFQHAGALATALKLDMKAWFNPNAANYFTRVSKPQILDALKEGRSKPNAPAWEKLKKPELAALAERELAGKGWLPDALRLAA